MYLDRIQLRRDLITRHEDHVLAVNPPVIEAVQELYSWLVGRYLPRRYGDIFELLRRQESSGKIETLLHNKVTDDIVPINPYSHSLEDALRIIGRQVGEDFLFLLPPALKSSWCLKHILPVSSRICLDCEKRPDTR